MTIKFDNETFRVMGLFEEVTHAALKDCIIQPQEILFLVEPGEAGKAIGKGGFVVRNLERALKRKIKIVEFNPLIDQFIKNLVAPSPILAVNEKEDFVEIVPSDTRARSLIIGRNATNLRLTEEIVKRYFPIKELKVSNVQ